ncbi:unnamed protein product [Notodromas monacha]|uniref:Phospholipase A2 n=1 Tax=Notodromas monacha TaxID=399045 RepID=A0A7R9BP39_9CRUS|nr:unnamed protein product [Notodromas monacha]CAG0919094.1 unnamed protein product [Notodromas monacha]
MAEDIGGGGDEEDAVAPLPSDIAAATATGVANDDDDDDDDDAGGGRRKKKVPVSKTASVASSKSGKSLLSMANMWLQRQQSSSSNSTSKPLLDDTSNNKDAVIKQCEDKDGFDCFQLFQVGHRSCAKLDVKVVRGENISKGSWKDFFDKPDPYVRLRVPKTPNGWKETKPVDNNLNPVWDDEFEFFVDLEEQSDLVLDHVIGRATIPFRPDIEPHIVHEKKIPIRKGFIHMELLLTPQAESDLRYSLALCQGEKEFLRKRCPHVFKAVRNLLGPNCPDAPANYGEVPIVAVLGSGGGYRAMVGMLGCAKAMMRSGIWDCVTYASALSGSSWFLSTLYSHPEFPGNPDALQTELRVNVTERDWNVFLSTLYSHPEFPGNPDALQTELRVNVTERDWKKNLNASRVVKYARLMARKHAAGQPVSFTDFFSHMLADAIMPEASHIVIDVLLLIILLIVVVVVVVRAKVALGTAPFPLYTALHAKRDVSADEFHEWVEFSPFEIGMPKYGVFLKTEDFGSKFYIGSIIKRYPEPPLTYLQGELHRKQVVLSQQRAKVALGTAPFPLYTALHAKRDVSADEFHEWVEFSPFEIGMPKYGVFLKTEDFGSKFYIGSIIKRYPEPPLTYLQGIWGSAFTILFKRLIAEANKKDLIERLRDRQARVDTATAAALSSSRSSSAVTTPTHERRLSINDDVLDDEADSLRREMAEHMELTLNKASSSSQQSETANADDDDSPSEGEELPMTTTTMTVVANNSNGTSSKQNNKKELASGAKLRRIGRTLHAFAANKRTLLTKDPNQQQSVVIHHADDVVLDETEDDDDDDDVVNNENHKEKWQENDGEGTISKPHHSNKLNNLLALAKKSTNRTGFYKISESKPTKNDSSASPTIIRTDRKMSNSSKRKNNRDYALESSQGSEEKLDDVDKQDSLYKMQNNAGNFSSPYAADDGPREQQQQQQHKSSSNDKPKMRFLRRYWASENTNKDRKSNADEDELRRRSTVGAEVLLTTTRPDKASDDDDDLPQEEEEGGDRDLLARRNGSSSSPIGNKSNEGFASGRRRGLRHRGAVRKVSGQHGRDYWKVQKLHAKEEKSKSFWSSVGQRILQSSMFDNREARAGAIFNPLRGLKLQDRFPISPFAQMQLLDDDEEEEDANDDDKEEETQQSSSVNHHQLSSSSPPPPPPADATAGKNDKKEKKKKEEDEDEDEDDEETDDGALFKSIKEAYDTAIKKIFLVDAGLAFNSPFPLVLRPQRGVDLFISFDFSGRISDNIPPFKELLLAEKWAKQNNIPFPPVEKKVRETLIKEPVREFYVFKDDNDPTCPVVIHIVLHNGSFREFDINGKARSEAKDRDFADFHVFSDPENPYSTFNFRFTGKSFDRLVALMEYNTLKALEDVKAELRSVVRAKRAAKHEPAAVKSVKDLLSFKFSFSNDGSERLKQLVERMRSSAAAAAASSSATVT